MEMYPSDLTDAEWAILSPLIPTGKPGGRPRDYPPRSMVYGYFALFRDAGVWEQMMTTLREGCWAEAGRHPGRSDVRVREWTH